MTTEIVPYLAQATYQGATALPPVQFPPNLKAASIQIDRSQWPADCEVGLSIEISRDGVNWKSFASSTEDDTCGTTTSELGVKFDGLQSSDFQARGTLTVLKGGPLVTTLSLKYDV